MIVDKEQFRNKEEIYRAQSVKLRYPTSYISDEL